jgi:DNA-nicking Smr family endonuclease
LVLSQIEFTPKPVDRKSAAYKEGRRLLKWLFPVEPDEVVDAALGQVDYNPTRAGQLIKSWQADNAISEIVAIYQEASFVESVPGTPTVEQDNNEGVDFLQNVYPTIPKSRLWEMLSEAGGDTQKVLDEMERKDETAAHEEDTIHQDPLVRFLKESFPNVPVFVIETKLKLNDGDMGRTTDELLNASVIRTVGDDMHLQGYKSKPRNKVKRSKPEAVQKNEIEVVATCLGINTKEATRIYQRNNYSIVRSIGSDQGTSKDLATARQTASAHATAVARETEGSRALTRDVRTRLEHISEQREHAIEKIQQMRSKISQNAAYATAISVYAERASIYAGTMKELSDQLWERKVDEQSDRYVVDYHGIPLKSAMDTIALKVHNWWTHEQQNPTSSSLKIITGAGRHSSGGIPVIKNAVRKYLRENQWDFDESTSYFLVHGPRKHATK